MSMTVICVWKLRPPLPIHNPKTQSHRWVNTFSVDHKAKQKKNSSKGFLVMRTLRIESKSIELIVYMHTNVKEYI